jgi:hypothetical protein
MTANEWITDRSPTAADGDKEGDVCIVTGPGRDGEDEYAYVHWSYVGQRAPWRHSRNWEPPDEPDLTEKTDRIAALEQRVAELEKVVDYLIERPNKRHSLGVL